MTCAGAKANCDYPESLSAIFCAALGVKYGSGLSHIAIASVLPSIMAEAFF